LLAFTNEFCENALLTRLVRSYDGPRQQAVDPTVQGVPCESGFHADEAKNKIIYVSRGNRCRHVLVRARASTLSYIELASDPRSDRPKSAPRKRLSQSVSCSAPISVFRGHSRPAPHISPQPYKLPITVSSLMPADGLRCKAAQTARRPRPIRIILWTTTALLHCAPLFFHLGVDLAEGLLAACVGLAQLAQLKPQVAALTLDRGEVVLEPLGAPLE